MAVGGMSELQLAWLEQQLNQAVADKVLVIVASHHRAEGASSIGTGSEELLALLSACPNVILHLAGHGHANLATPRTAEGNDPLHGYWEVETTSVATFPQQARILEVVDNRDGTGSIYMTIFDHWMTEGDESDVLARLGRELAFGDELEGGHRGDASFSGRGAERDRNVELLFQIPPEIADRLARIDNGKPITSTDSLGQRYNR